MEMIRQTVPNRSIALGIILTLVTCGIYGLYWQIGRAHV